MINKNQYIARINDFRESQRLIDDYFYKVAKYIEEEYNKGSEPAYPIKLGSDMAESFCELTLKEQSSLSALLREYGWSIRYIEQLSANKVYNRYIELSFAI